MVQRYQKRISGPLMDRMARCALRPLHERHPHERAPGALRQAGEPGRSRVIGCGPGAGGGGARRADGGGSAVGSLNGGEVSYKMNREVVLMIGHPLIYARLLEVFLHAWEPVAH